MCSTGPLFVSAASAPTISFAPSKHVGYEGSRNESDESTHTAAEYPMFGSDPFADSRKFAEAGDETSFWTPGMHELHLRSLPDLQDATNDMDQISQSLANLLLESGEDARPTDVTVDSLGSCLDSDYSYNESPFLGRFSRTSRDGGEFIWNPSAEGSVYSETKEETSRGLGPLFTNQLYSSMHPEGSIGGLPFPNEWHNEPQLPYRLKAVSPTSRLQQQQQQQQQQQLLQQQQAQFTQLQPSASHPNVISRPALNPIIVPDGPVKSSEFGAITPPGGISPVADQALMQVIVVCQDILKDAAKKSLKAVELANTLRARVGTEVLAVIREKYGGLLSLLEMYPNVFCVDRVPKNDSVSLVEKASNSRQSHSPHSVDDGSTTDSAHAQSNEFVSRCLHIGNVPATLGEAELRKEFERYGAVEYLKVVTQRGRRYAFVNFQTVDEAVRAKQRLSRLHPWKSAISFARKDMRHSHSRGNSNASSIDDNSSVTSHESSTSRSTSTSSMPPHIPLSTRSMMLDCGEATRWASPSPSSPSLRTSIAFPMPTAAMQQHMRSQSLQSHELASVSWGHVPSSLHHGSDGAPHRRSHTADYNLLGNSNMRLMDLMVQPHQQQAPVAYVQVPVQWPIDASGQLYTHVQMNQLAAHPQQQQLNHPSMIAHSQSAHAQHHAAFASGGYAMCEADLRHAHVSSPPLYVPEPGCAVLERLTDDTYVPTQLWPTDPIGDGPYVRAILAQLQQLGGSTNVSKLRGFLRNRVSSTQNIKSVPLKALLTAYPSLFVVKNNQVTLASLIT